MKKLVIFVFFIAVIYFSFIKKETKIVELPLEIKKYMDIEDFYVYGNHFNLKGIIGSDISEIKLLIGDVEYELILEKNDVNTTFYTSKIINKGINLEEFKLGNHKINLLINGELFYLRSKNTEKIKYYNFKKNLIEIDNNELSFDVKKSKKEVYDIVIDAGHGGIDPGAVNGKVYEKDLNLKIADQLENKLKKAGFKVFMTRNDDVNNKRYEAMDRINSSFESNAKLFISIHHNSSHDGEYYRGLEIFVPSKTDYSFASEMADNISKSTLIPFSNMDKYKIDKGICQRFFTSQDIVDLEKELALDNVLIYPNITPKTDYYFMLRETGGKITNAYVDGRNKDKDLNDFHTSNIGMESLLLEIAYINNKQDLKIALEKSEEFAEAISSTIINNYKKYLVY